MEIMASLPSVVLGFLAALWLAPLIETRVPSILLMVVFIPAAAMAFGWFWSSLPVRYRALIRPGFEFLVFTPIFVIGMYLCWELGPVVERFLFVVTNPATGEQVADFRRWWPQFAGADFQQRELAFDVVGARHVGDLDDVDELAELLLDLIDDGFGPGRDERQARHGLVGRGRDIQALDVVAARGKHVRHARKRTGLVLQEYGDDMSHAGGAGAALESGSCWRSG
jgi:hypothetical protein